MLNLGPRLRDREGQLLRKFCVAGEGLVVADSNCPEDMSPRPAVLRRQPSHKWQLAKRFSKRTDLAEGA
jgi:hypothetical protein